MSEESLEFDLELKEIKVKIGAENYVLREATSEVAVKYRRFIISSRRTDGKGYKVDLAEAEPVLVSMCLFKEDGKLAGEAFVKKLPERILKTLFIKARDMSKMNESGDKEEENEELKKLRKDSESGSS